MPPAAAAWAALARFEPVRATAAGTAIEFVLPAAPLGATSWAVTVDKADGSRLVGYVFTGATGSEVFDWKVLKEPKPIVVTVPAPNQPSSAKPAKGDDDD